MPRDSYRPLAVVGLVAALLGYVGCSTKSPPKQTDSAPRRRPR